MRLRGGCWVAEPERQLLVEDEETGARSYRYVKTGTNHYSFAFTYDCIAWSRDRCRPCRIAVGTPDDNFYDPILHGLF